MNSARAYLKLPIFNRCATIANVISLLYKWYEKQIQYSKHLHYEWWRHPSTKMQCIILSRQNKIIIMIIFLLLILCFLPPGLSNHSLAFCLCSWSSPGSSRWRWSSRGSSTRRRDVWRRSWRSWGLATGFTGWLGSSIASWSCSPAVCSWYWF